MTEKLFRENPYQTEFEAKVLSINDKKVVLDRTCFFPQGGGQVGDSGELNGTRVVDTRREGDNIVHVLEGEPNFRVGDAVHGRIDWDRRYKTMRLHSAAHVVQYLMHQVFGEQCKPASPGLVDDKKDRTDYFFTEKLDRDKLKQVEEKANELISRGLEIRTWSDGRDVERRCWKVEPFPPMPCGGTHPRSLEEVGRIRVERGKKPGGGKERIEVSLVEKTEFS